MVKAERTRLKSALISPVICPGTGQGRARPGPRAGLGSGRRAGKQETPPPPKISKEEDGRGGEERRGHERQLAGRKQDQDPPTQPSPTLQIKLTVFGPGGSNRQAFPRFQLALPRSGLLACLLLLLLLVHAHTHTHTHTVPRHGHID